MSKRLASLVAVTVFWVTLGFGPNVFGQTLPPAPPGDAGETTTALANAAITAVLSITTGVNMPGASVANYSEAISLLIKNNAIRLLTDDSANSLGGNNSKARGAVERDLLEQAFSGTALTPVWQTDGNHLVTIYPLPNLPMCATCHSEFIGGDPIVGGLLIKVQQ